MRELEAFFSKIYAQTNDGAKFHLGQITGSSVVSGETVYEVTGSTVDTLQDEKYSNCHSLGVAPGAGDFAVIGADKDGERFMLPSPSGLLAVEDVGSGQAKEVVINESGTVSTPSDSETLDYVVIEGGSFFYDATPTTKTGRRYPAIKLPKSSGSGNFYVVFVEGHGEEVTTFEDTVTVNDGDTLTVTIGVDGQGNVTSLNLTSE